MPRPLYSLLKPFVAGAVLLGAAACSRGPEESFRQVELSKEEMISLYKIPVQDRPAMKFEWNFAAKKYVRLVVEQAPTERGPWTTLHQFAYGFGLTKVWLILKIEDQAEMREQAKSWTIATRIGGAEGSFSGWTGSTFDIPWAGREYETRTDSFNPASFYEVRSKSIGIVRFRLEASPQRFAATVAREPHAAEP